MTAVYLKATKQLHSTVKLAQRTGTDEVIQKRDQRCEVVCYCLRWILLPPFRCIQRPPNCCIVYVEPPFCDAILERPSLRLEKHLPTRQLHSPPLDNQVGKRRLLLFQGIVTVGINFPILGLNEQLLQGREIFAIGLLGSRASTASQRPTK